MARSLRENDIDNYNGTQIPGYYQRTSLDNIINNFIVSYIGSDKVLANIPRYEVAYWAQRAVQEFSFDVLHSENSQELELNEAKIAMLPPDYVNLIRITRTDRNGNTIDCKRSSTTKPAKPVIQDDEYQPIYDENGDIIYADESESIKRARQHRYNDAYNFANGDRDLDAQAYYAGYFYGYDFSYYDIKRFGLQTQLANEHYVYILDNNTGLVYFNQDFKQDDVITLFYISDGLANGDNLDNVYVPKMAEDAIYADILYNLSKLRPAAAGAAALYKKEAMAKKRNTKIRLMNLKSSEMVDVMRGKSKWIKH